MTSQRTLLILSGAALAAAVASACGGSVDLNFVGEDGGGGQGGDRNSAACGDGVVAGDEECDDRNTAASDGCSASCQTEPGYACSGAPSDCERTVGNGDIDAGETCDDGNLESGDGCSDTGQIEGTCEAPVELTLKDEDGILRARRDSSTSGGGESVDAAACGGEEAGAGADRVFSFTLEEKQDVRVVVESAANLAVRLTGACGSASDVAFCRDAEGANSDEVLVAPNLEPGTYFITVDGSTGSAEGDFTLTVQAECPLEALRLEELHGRDYASRWYIALRNTSRSCGVRLSRAGLAVARQTSAEALPLPDTVLGPQRELRITGDSSSWPDDLLIDDPYWYFFSQSIGALLCRGACDQEEGTNVFDAFQAGTDAPELPSGVSFDPDPFPAPPSGGDPYAPNFAVFERVKQDGAAPSFKLGDWRAIWAWDLNRTYWDYTYPPVTVTGVSPFAEPLYDDNFGGYLAVTRTVSATDGFVGYNIAVQPGLRNPKTITFSVRRVSPTGQACDVKFGTAASPTALAWLTYNDTTHFIFTSPTTPSPSPPAVGTWQTVSLRNIDWTDQSFDVWIDGALYASDRGSSGDLAEVSNIQVGTYTANTACDFGPIIMTP